MANERRRLVDDPKQLGMFVLDVLQHDVAEQVDSILCLLNNTGCIGWREFWSHDFTIDEVLGVLQGLLRDGLVELLREDPTRGELVAVNYNEVSIEGDLEVLWFGRTNRGCETWDAWEPPT